MYSLLRFEMSFVALVHAEGKQFSLRSWSEGHLHLWPTPAADDTRFVAMPA